MADGGFDSANQEFGSVDDPESTGEVIGIAVAAALVVIIVVIAAVVVARRVKRRRWQLALRTVARDISGSNSGKSTELASIISDRGAQTALPDNFLSMNGEAEQDTQDAVDGRVFDSEMNRSFLQI